MLNNYLKHGQEVWQGPEGEREPDQFSSARYFDGWEGYDAAVKSGAPECPVAKGCWKSAVGWKRRFAKLAIGAVPGR